MTLAPGQSLIQNQIAILLKLNIEATPNSVHKYIALEREGKIKQNDQNETTFLPTMTFEIKFVRQRTEPLN